MIMANANREGTKISWHLLFCLAFSVVTGLACILVQYVIVVGKVSLPYILATIFHKREQ